MIARNFRPGFTGADWQALRLSVALVSRDAAIAAANGGDEWLWVAHALRRIGVRAASRDSDDDLALAVLADFAEESQCQETLALARDLARQLSAPQLLEHIDYATGIVDRVSPEQSFRFRVTLTLVSMLMSEGSG